MLKKGWRSSGLLGREPYYPCPGKIPVVWAAILKAPYRHIPSLAAASVALADIEDRLRINLS